MNALCFINGNVTAPLLPVLTVTQVAQSAKGKVVWPESPGAVKYRVQYGTTTKDYDVEAIIDASAGLCQHITADYPDGMTIYFVVSAIGANGVESALSEEGSVAIDAYSILGATFALTAPAAGVEAATSTVAEALDYTLKSAAWADADETALAVGQPFVAGTKYYATVVLQVEEGHVFNAAVEIDLPDGVIDAVATINAAATELTVVCEYLALTTDALTFTLAAPVKEANSAEAAVDAGATYEVVSTAWMDAAEVPLETGAPFLAATVYHAVVVIAAKADKRLKKPFADLGITLPATSTLVTQSVDTALDENQIAIEISFPATAA